MLGRRYHSTESSLGLSGTAVMSVVSRRIPTKIPMVATLFRVTWESTIAARLVTAAAALVPALPRLGAKMGADVLLFFVNYLLQKAFVY